MDRKQLLNPDAVKILTTEEFLAFEKQERIKAYVHRRMDKGKQGQTHGWVMSEILQSVKRSFGLAGAVFAREYIVNDVCAIKKPRF